MVPMPGELLEVAERVALAPAGLLRGSGDVGHLALLRRLAVGVVRVVDLMADVAMSRSTASTHLEGLRPCGLVPDGRTGAEHEVERLRQVRELPAAAVAEVFVIANRVRAGRTKPLPASLGAPVQPAPVGTSGAFR